MEAGPLQSPVGLPPRSPSFQKAQLSPIHPVRSLTSPLQISRTLCSISEDPTKSTPADNSSPRCSEEHTTGQAQEAFAMQESMLL